MSGRARWAAALFVLTVVVCAFHDLGGRNLHDGDTSRWGQLAREMVRTGEWLVPTRYGELYVNKPVLYLWAVAGPARLVGEVTPFLVRLPSAMGLILMVLATAWWTRLRTGSAKTGRIAGLLVLSTFFVAWLGRAGRLDMMGAGLSVAAAAVLDRAALGLGTKRTPWLAGLLVGACLLTKGPPLLLVPLAVLFVPSEGRGARERLRGARPLLVLAVAVVTTLLWFVPAVMQAGWDEYGHKLLVGQAAERIGGTIDQREPAWHYLVGLPLEGAPWGLLYVGLAVAIWRPRVRRALGPVAGLALAGSVLLILFTLIPTKHVRYLAPVVPLFAMPLAAWVSTRLTGPTRAAWPRHLTLLTGLCAAGALALVVGAVLQAHAWFAFLVPAVAFGAVAWAAWVGVAGKDPRRRFVVCVLYFATFAMLAQAVVRPRYYETRKEHFNRRVEELRAGGVPVWITRSLTPEAVFHGAPDARYFIEPGQPVPRTGEERLLVIGVRADAAALRDGAGRPGRILEGLTGKRDWVIVGFGYP